MKVLIIGLGSIAKKHVAALTAIDPGVKILALRHSASAPPVDNVQSIFSLEEIGQAPDFIIISNPTSDHVATIRQCLTQNVPLFIEKPLSHRLEGVENLIQQIKKQNIPTYVGCNLRFRSCLQFVKQYLVENECVVNEVNAYCGSYLPEWRPGADFRKIYSANREAGGGVHLDLIHELDYLFWLFAEPATVQKQWRSSSSLRIDAVDYANYNLNYDSFTVSLILNYFRRDAKRTLEILFDDDTWMVDIINNSVTSLCSGKNIFASEEKIIDTYRKQMEYFLQAIRKEQPLMNDIEEAFKVLKICLE